MVPHARLTDTHGHRCAPFSISGRGYFTRYSHIPGAHKAQVFQYLTFLLKEGAEGTNQQAWISVGAPCITELLRCISAPLLLTETWDLCSQVSNHSQKPKVYVSQQPRTWTGKMLKALHAQYSRVKIQQNTLYVVVDPGKEKGILCSNLLLHTELQFEACSDWSCIRCNRGWFTPASNQNVDHQHEDGSKFASS